MRRLLPPLLCALLSAPPVFGGSLDTTVTLPAPRQPITATLHGPAAPGPAVLLLHGFTGSRDEMRIPAAEEGVFARTARHLARAGLTSLRIDFRGSGDSTGRMSFADSDFETQVEDTLLALDWLRDRGYGPLHVIGWSQGGMVAALAAGRGAGVASVSLWNAVGEPMETYPRILGQEVIRRGMDAPDPETLIDTTLPWGDAARLRAGFIHQMSRLDPVEGIARYPGPVMVAWGSADPLVPESSAERFLAAHRGAGVAYRRPFDHAFDIGTGPKELDALIAHTIAFLTKTPS